MEVNHSHGDQLTRLIAEVQQVIDGVLEKYGFDVLVKYDILEPDNWEKVAVGIRRGKLAEKLFSKNHLGLDVVSWRHETFDLKPYLIARGYDGNGGMIRPRDLAWELSLMGKFVDFLNELFENNHNYIQALNLASRVRGNIESVQISSFFSLQDVKIDGLSSRQEVYFVGENGEGKTLLLMSIFLAFCGFHYEAEDLVEDVTRKLILETNGFSCTGYDGMENVFQFRGERVDLSDHLAKKIRERNLNVEGKFTYLQDFYCYGANRSWVDSDSKPATDFASLFTHEAKLFNPVRLLEQAYHVSKYRDGVPEKENFKLTPEALIQLFERLMEGRVKIIQKDGAFKFKEKNYEVDFYNLSEGYRNILIWVGDMLTRLQKNNPEIKDIREYQAVVLVDEIDLHLHPRWQVNFVRTLRKEFPKIQFFFTTHSPIMLQGAGEDAVFYRVYRNAEGHTEVSAPYYKKDMHDMMFNTLMTSPLFGMDSARLSPETEDADTSVSSLRKEIDRQVRAQLDARRNEGITYISEKTIEDLVRKALEAEMNK